MKLKKVFIWNGVLGYGSNGKFFVISVVIYGLFVMYGNCVDFNVGM